MSVALGLACLAAGLLLGAMVGGAWAWRQLQTRFDSQLPAQLHAAMAPLLQSHLEKLQTQAQSPPLGVEPRVEASIPVARTEDVVPAWVAEVVQAMRTASATASFSEQATRGGLADHAKALKSQADAQQEVLRVMQDRLEAWLCEWQQEVQRVPQLLQQVLQVELDFMRHQQTQRDQTMAQQHERLQAEQARLAAQREERHATELRTLMQAVAARTAKPVEVAERASVERPVAALPRVPLPNPSPAPAISARPPELFHAPLPRPEPIYEEEAEPTPELSDEEIDALPPELPAADKPRKRILPAPKSPTLRNL